MRRAVLVLFVLGCGSGGNHVAPAANPLGTTDDILPYPSSLYERTDASSPTGVVLDVPQDAFPTNVNTGSPIDPTPIDARHGWPATTTILWAAQNGVDSSKLVPFTNIAQSVGPDSTTVILDMTTHQRVAHFAEVDANEGSDFSHQAVILRPAARLAGGHRYAVAIRKELTARDGSPLRISPGFQAVLDDRSIGHARLDADRPRLREAISALEAAGIPRTDLVVAWDFTVADDASEIADPLAARDAALAAMGPLGANLTYTVTSDQGTVNGDPRIARRLEVDFQVPQVSPPGLVGFNRDASGAVVAQGMMTAHAYIQVPPCATATNKAGILMYGHGFFGGLDELRNSEYLRDLSQDGCLIIAGTPWVGMSSDDVSNALLALNDLNKAWGFGQHVWQGIVDAIALEQLLRGQMATQLLVDAQGMSIVDPTREYYLGISQGHILGSTFVAYDPFITRGVLHVGGANWSLMFERSVNWTIYGVPLKSAYPLPLDTAIMEQVLEMALVGVDGATVAGVDLPNTPAKSILMQTSMGDAQVPNLASFFQARSLGLTLITPSVTTPFGFETAQAATSDRALVLMDEHPTPLPPDTNATFGADNDAHENPRRRVAIQQMMRDFWATGMAQDTCVSACDCKAGNCGALRLPMYGGT